MTSAPGTARLPPGPSPARAAPRHRPDPSPRCPCRALHGSPPVHVRLYDPKRNPRSCEQLPPALRLRCEHHVALAQTSMRLAAFSTIIESSHVHLFDAKCVATLEHLPSCSACHRAALDRGKTRKLAGGPVSAGGASPRGPRVILVRVKKARSAPSVPPCGAPHPWQRRVRKVAAGWVQADHSTARAPPRQGTAGYAPSSERGKVLSRLSPDAGPDAPPSFSHRARALAGGLLALRLLASWRSCMQYGMRKSPPPPGTGAM